jgi:hypothetical protein
MRKLAVSALAAWGLAGCASLPHEHPQRQLDFGSPADRDARERALNGQWQNRRLDELVAALGPPALVMSIPGGGNPPGFVVVYGADQRTGCIDAFAITHEPDARVRIYHCR